jgi:S-adenosylmethionine synthetase
LKRDIVVTEFHGTAVAEQEIEVVERKGLGHPDSICDALAEASAMALTSYYLDRFGRVLHFNVDKALLSSGQADVAFGGGRLMEPMTFTLSGQATREWHGQHIPTTELFLRAGTDWVRRHLRFVDPTRDIVFCDEVRPGSPELVDVYQRQPLVANDSSIGVGYAPLSPTEELTLALERHVNSPLFKQDFPASGEDVKVLAVRRGRQLELTIAMPLVSRFIPNEQQYFQSRSELLRAIEGFVRGRLPKQLAGFGVVLNALDVPAQGLAGVYLTVTGTSAEAGDAGQVGRGNRPNGLIAYSRPLSVEAVAGKNPAAHVGKIYTLLSFQLAGEIYATVPGIREVYVRLCSRIGSPIDQPLLAAAELVLQPGVTLASVSRPVRRLIDDRLAAISGFTDRLARRERLHPQREHFANP